MPGTVFPKPLKTGAPKKWTLFLGVIERIPMSLPPWEFAMDCKDGPRQRFEHPGPLEWTGELDWREQNRGV